MRVEKEGRDVVLIPEELKDMILLDKLFLLKDRPELFINLLTFLEEQYEQYYRFGMLHRTNSGNDMEPACRLY